MKIGLLLFIAGVALVLYLSRVKFEKTVLIRIGIIIGVFLSLYGLILVVQPSEDKYVKFTKSTISKEDSKN
ncbi:MAG: hypothetical protein U9Q04_00970 [Campylobacterota bacterium]|nr:hypothetical protein [Campylobacterota bacterium]